MVPVRAFVRRCEPRTDASSTGGHGPPLM
jgi:hypothetical protein